MKLNKTIKINIIWKFIFYLLFFIFFISTIGLFLIPGIDVKEKVITITTFIINLLGIYGYVWKKKIFAISFWRIFFIIAIIENIYYGIVKFGDLPQMTIFDIIFASIVSIIAYIPIYLYAFRSKYIWKAKKLLNEGKD